MPPLSAAERPIISMEAASFSPDGRPAILGTGNRQVVRGLRQRQLDERAEIAAILARGNSRPEGVFVPTKREERAMHHGWPFGLALLVLAGAAPAQEQPSATGCAGLSPDSFEAAVLGCPQAAEPAEIEGPPQVLDVIGEAPEADLPARPQVLRLGQSDGRIPELEASDPQVVQLSSSAAEAARKPSPVPEPSGRNAASLRLSIPDAQIPPPGTCRVWFPERHSGLQRPPTSCDVEVPIGAVLIRG